MLSDPNSASTSAVTLSAFKEKGILDSVISALVDFVPFGADGDGNADLQFEETCIRQVYIRFYSQLPANHLCFL